MSTRVNRLAAPEPPVVRSKLARFLWGSSPLHVTIAIYQCFGGVLGFVALLDVAPGLLQAAPDSARESGRALWILSALPLLLLTLSGFALLRWARIGRPLTLLSQGLQVLLASTATFTYVFTGGLYAGLVVQNGATRAFAGWQVYVGLGRAFGEQFIAINLVPLVLMALVLYDWRRDRSQISSESSAT